MFARAISASLALSALVALGTAAQLGYVSSEEEKPYVVGMEVDKPIELVDIDGKTHKLGDLRGKPVVIDFWSCRCPYSVAWEQSLIDLHAKYKEQGVTFLAIDSNHTEVMPDTEDPYHVIREYVKKAKVTYPILIDEGNVIADRFAAKTTPHIFLIDGKGVVRYTGAIDNDSNPKKPLPEGEVEPWLDDAIAAVLAGKEVPKAETKAIGCTIKRLPTKP